MIARKRPLSRSLSGLLSVALGSIAISPAWAAGISARDVTTLLFMTAAGIRPALSGKDLSRLDLANLDFKKADLSKANLFGSDLSGANLAGANLSGADIDRVTLIGAHLDGANLDDASMMRPSTFAALIPVPGEAPSLKAASLRRTRFFGSFVGSDFSGADLTDAICAPTNKSGFIEHIWRTDFEGANLTGATLTRADMTRTQLSFAVLKNAIMRNVVLRDADLSGANLTGADLTGTDLSGADLSEADVTGANLDGVKLHKAQGLETLKGLALAHNSDKAVH
jgi:uncharacterized protein YjbI with pentapeptide repeats